MKQHLCVYLLFGWRVRSLFLVFAVVNNGELQQEEDNQQENDNRLNPAYLNPELYREGIASLVNAKERAEELMYKNDIIAQLVTEMPYHEIQNRLLISGNHKEVNRSFFVNLNLKDARSGNCGRFDVYRLLDMVQRSRERAMLETTTSACGLDSDVDSNVLAASSIPRDETTSEDPTPNSASVTDRDQPFDWVQLAEASKQLLEQKAMAASQEASLTSTAVPLFQDSNQQLPTLLKLPLLKNQPLSDAVSSVLLSRMGETLNLPRQNKLPSAIRSRLLPEALLSTKNQQSPQLKTNEMNNIRIGQALESYSRDINDYRNARNYFLKHRINS